MDGAEPAFGEVMELDEVLELALETAVDCQPKSIHTDHYKQHMPLDQCLLICKTRQSQELRNVHSWHNPFPAHIHQLSEVPK